MRHSDSIAKVSAALVAAQAELQNVVCDAENPHFRSSYASLPALLDTVRPVLARHQLALVQLPIGSAGRVSGTDDVVMFVGIETILLHASGEWIGAELLVRPVKEDPQGAGSALTYCRRYSLAAALAIGQEDDDGNAASGRPKRPERAQKPPRETPQPVPSRAGPSDAISEAQVKRLWAIARKAAADAGWPDRDADQAIRSFLEGAGYSSSKEIPRSRYDQIVHTIEGMFAPWEPK